MAALRARHSRHVDYRRHPERYHVGRGEEGVLTVEPYTSELLPLWRFATPALAAKSAAAILAMFRRYRRARDFVGMDMARKFLQMGYTRARRYARHRGGRKYGADGTELPETHDATKQRSADVFATSLATVRADPRYVAARHHHHERITARRPRQLRRTSAPTSRRGGRRSSDRSASADARRSRTPSRARRLRRGRSR